MSEEQNNSDLQNAESQNDSGDNSSKETQPFLTVNDRTSFATQEEAIKSFDEAGNRISELTPFHKVAVDEFGLDSSEELKQVLAEYIELKNAGTSQEKDDSGTVETDAKVDSDGFTTEQNDAIKALKVLGLPTGEDFKKLQAELTSVRESRDTDRETNYQNLIRTGRSVALEMFKTENIPTELHENAETFIRGYLERGGTDKNEQLVYDSALERFYRGGADQQAAVQEAMDAYKAVVQHGKTSAGKDYSKDKKTAIDSNNKPVGDGRGSDGNREDGKKPRTDAQVHEAAWKRFSEIQSQQN